MTNDARAGHDPTEEREAPPVPRRFNLEEAQAAVRRLQAAAADSQDEALQDPETRTDAERAVSARRAYLARLGFEPAAWDPAWDRIPEEWRGALAAYTSNLAGYVRHGQGPYLGAAVGRGKTCGLALIALAAHGAGIPCGYVLCGADLVWACDQQDRMAQARAARFSADETFDPDRKPWPYMDLPLLLLDDLDLLRGTGYDPEREGWDTVGMFLYHRMARGLATAIASNLLFGSMTKDGAEVPLGQPLPEGARAGLSGKPGMLRVASRWQVRIPEALRLMTTRGDQRADGPDLRKE